MAVLWVVTVNGFLSLYKVCVAREKKCTCSALNSRLLLSSFCSKLKAMTMIGMHIASREPGTSKILTLFLLFGLLWEVTNFVMAYYDPLRIPMEFSIRCNPKCGFYSWFCGWNSYVHAIFCI